MRIYIAGPMTGYPEFNQAAFATAEMFLTEGGERPINPAELHGLDLENMTGEEILSEVEFKQIVKTDLDALQTCDAIFMLEGWERSLGARAEHAVASWLGLDIRYQT